MLDAMALALVVGVTSQLVPACSERGQSALWLGLTSQCSGSVWLDWMARENVFAKAPGGGDRPLVFFNVGANKGYAIASMVKRFTPKTNVSAQSWHQHLTAYARGKKAVALCGNCDACKEQTQPSPPRKVHSYAFELIRSNTDWLHQAVHVFGLRRLVTVMHAAASNESATVAMPQEDVELGHEGTTAGPRRAGAAKTLRSVALDDYMRRHAIHATKSLIVTRASLRRISCVTAHCSLERDAWS